MKSSHNCKAGFPLSIDEILPLEVSPQIKIEFFTQEELETPLSSSMHAERKKVILFLENTFEIIQLCLSI